MQAFTVHKGLVAPMDRANVDTDAIIPKQFLKAIARTGFGPNLFDAWRYLDKGEPGQAEVARQRIRQAGVEHRCRGVVEDFFAWCEPESFDGVTSVGAAEHVAESRFDDYFKLAQVLLRPGGQFLHHAITRTPSVPDRPGRSFNHRYVFSEHFLASIGQTLSAAEIAGFETRDVESPREH